MKSDRKPVSSKLSPFSRELLALNDEGKKLPQIQQWLKERGMSASISTISNFLTRERTERGRKANSNIGYALPYFPKLQATLQRFQDEEWKRQDRRQKAQARKAKWYQANKVLLKKRRKEAEL